METGWQPVADDHNEALELVIFDSSADWKRYGSALFGGVSTDNGGIYLEGDPPAPATRPASSPTRQSGSAPPSRCGTCATSTCTTWTAASTSTAASATTLNRTTWWSEGLAEFIAHGQCFARGLDNVAGRPCQRSSGPGRHPAPGLRQGRRDGLLVLRCTASSARPVAAPAGWPWPGPARPDQQQAMSAFEAELDALIANATARPTSSGSAASCCPGGRPTRTLTRVQGQRLCPLRTRRG